LLMALKIIRWRRGGVAAGWPVAETAAGSWLAAAISAARRLARRRNGGYCGSGWLVRGYRMTKCQPYSAIAKRPGVAAKQRNASRGSAIRGGKIIAAGISVNGS